MSNAQNLLTEMPRWNSSQTDFEKERIFSLPIKRMKLKTLEDMNKKVKLITSKNKIVQLKQQGNIAFQLCAVPGQSRHQDKSARATNLPSDSGSLQLSHICRIRCYQIWDHMVVVDVSN